MSGGTSVPNCGDWLDLVFFTNVRVDWLPSFFHLWVPLVELMLTQYRKLMPLLVHMHPKRLT